MRYEAAYARQSVEKKNSLSIKGQLDLCTQTSGNSSLLMYSDQGYSGKNTDRPDFQRLLKDIKADKVSKLYVYRLDRFSRSIADFGQLWNVLQAHNVEFVSVTENFDTSTPMGRAMLHIIMVFAQLERETTAERVKDNYDSRQRLARGPVDLLLTAIATDGQARGVLHWSRTWSSWRLSAVYLRSTPKRALPSKALPIC